MKKVHEHTFLDKPTQCYILYNRIVDILDFIFHGNVPCIVNYSMIYICNT